MNCQEVLVLQMFAEPSSVLSGERCPPGVCVLAAAGGSQLPGRQRAAEVFLSVGGAEGRRKAVSLLLPSPLGHKRRLEP